MILQIISGSYGYCGVKLPAAAKTKGLAELVNGVLAVPFDNTTASQQPLMVFRADQVETVASAASTDIAAVNFLALQKVYWDAAASKITNVSTSNTAVGRSLENKNLSGGVALGDKHLWELTPDVL